MLRPAIERFWKKVARLGPDDCWLWTAALYGNGYGHFYIGDGRFAPAHVFSLELALGRRLLPGMRGLHTCDNRPCVNPAHLFEGTQRDNIRDMIAKGRGNLQNGAQAGERNPRAKITAAEAEEIRALSWMRQKDIAVLYGITQGVVSKIVRREIWANDNDGAGPVPG